jgi:hypothetical protein
VNRSQRGANRSVGQRLELFFDKGHGPQDLQPPDVGPSKNVAGRPRRNRHLGKPEDAGRKVLAYVLLDTTGPRHGADQPQGEAVFLGDDPRVFEPGLHRRIIPKQDDRVGHVSIGRLQAFQTLLFSAFVEVEKGSAWAYHPA